MAAKYKTVKSGYAHVYRTINAKGQGSYIMNTVLMGSYVTLLDETNGEWQKVFAFGKEGWMHGSHLGNNPDLKCFFIDVGQGDGILIEVGNDFNGIKILIDGGPNQNMHRYFKYFQFKNNKKVHFDYVFVTHFDQDHYQGLISIIDNPNYTFGTIYHSGIAKFGTRPAEFNTRLGEKAKQDGIDYLVTSFSTIEELDALKDKGGMIKALEKFLDSVKNAREQGRVNGFERIDYNSTIPKQTINNKTLAFDVLGPVTSQVNHKLSYKYFTDEGHTINGHSIVLKLTYDDCRFLFNGDINKVSEENLINHYQNDNPFEVEVVKTSHHGSSDFSIDFLAKVNPLATVVSSGDNEKYSHPRADALGCAGKYSRASRPLVFSTELARSTNLKREEILYGLINLRSDDEKIIMAQMKEVKNKNGNPWDLYEVN